MWKSADINGIQEDLTHFAADFKDRRFDSVNSMWDSFKEQIYKTMERIVPSKMTRACHTHLGNEWKNKKTDQMETASTKNNRLMQDMDRYKRLQHDVQFQIRSAHKDFMETAVSDTFKDNPMKIWSFVKITGQEVTGVSH